jgi:hypothetical protein
MVGRPLTLSAGATAPRDHSFAESDLEGNVLESYRTADGWKVIEANPRNPRGLPPRQLFQTQKDPHEQHDLAATETQQAATLSAHLEVVQNKALNAAVGGHETAIDSATEERLRSLGYVK